MHQPIHQGTLRVQSQASVQDRAGPRHEEVEGGFELRRSALPRQRITLSARQGARPTAFIQKGTKHFDELDDNSARLALLRRLLRKVFSSEQALRLARRLLSHFWSPENVLFYIYCVFMLMLIWLYVQYRF